MWDYFSIIFTHTEKEYIYVKLDSETFSFRRTLNLSQGHWREDEIESHLHYKSMVIYRVRFLEITEVPVLKFGLPQRVATEKLGCAFQFCHFLALWS